MSVSNLPDQSVLDAVRVLVLVHQDVAEAPVVPVAHLGRSVEEGYGLQEQVIKVEGVGLAQRTLVEVVEGGEFLGRRVGGLLVKSLRRDAAVFGVTDGGERAAA